MEKFWNLRKLFFRFLSRLELCLDRDLSNPYSRKIVYVDPPQPESNPKYSNQNSNRNSKWKKINALFKWNYEKNNYKNDIPFSVSHVRTLILSIFVSKDIFFRKNVRVSLKMWDTVYIFLNKYTYLMLYILIQFKFYDFFNLNFTIFIISFINVIWFMIFEKVSRMSEYYVQFFMYITSIKFLDFESKYILVFFSTHSDLWSYSVRNFIMDKFWKLRIFLIFF